jgi:hypothetical protein
VRTPMCDIFPYTTDVDLIKIDIEGGEWSILSDSRFKKMRARAVMLEYHPWLAPNGDPGEQATRCLTQAGYTIRRHEAAQGGFGVVVASAKGNLHTGQ